MSGLAPFLHQTGVVSSTWDAGMEGASSGNWGSEGVSLDADVTPLACSCSRLLSCSMVRIASPAHASTARPAQTTSPPTAVSQSSVCHNHTALLARSSRPRLTLYSGLLSSVLTLYSGLLSSALRDSLHLFLSSGRSSYFRMVLCSFHFLPIFLLAQIL